MIIDNLLLVSDNQTFSAAAVSQNSIDTGTSAGAVNRNVATGEPVGFGLSVEASSLVSLLVELISATDGALTAGIIVHASRTFLAADVPAAALHFIQLNPGGTQPQRYLGVRVTPVGGAATATLNVWFSTKSAFSISAKSYPMNVPGGI